MSDYTPTTEEVRGEYEYRLIQTGTNSYELVDKEQAEAEFDRWLESIMQEAHIAERERIIKLLEEDCHSYDGITQCPCGAITPEQVDYVVALIKGENK